MKQVLVIDRRDSFMFWLALGNSNRILLAESGAEGLGMLSESVGLVFLNLKLPDMSGMEVLRHVRREHPGTKVIVIVSCAQGETCLCMEAFREGACDYVRNPLQAAEILGKIRDGIDSGPAFRTMQGAGGEIHGASRPGLPGNILKGVTTVKNFLEQNYSESLTTAEACKMAMISKTYFCRYFKSVTGHSLRNYQNMIKIRMAEELLRDKTLSVTEVAMRLGYADSNYFSTTYKKTTGISPRQRQAFFNNCGQQLSGRKGCH